MTTPATTDPNQIDQLLEQYENRPLTRSRTAIADHMHGLALGKELARLQGYTGGE